MNIDSAVANGKVTGMVHVTDAILIRLLGMKQEPTIHVSSYFLINMLLRY